MARRANRKPRQPEGSWVLDDGDHSDDLEPVSDASSEEEEYTRTPRAPNTRSRQKPPPVLEPQLVMPTLPASPSRATGEVRNRYHKTEVSTPSAIPPRYRSKRPQDPAAAHDETIAYYMEVVWTEMIQPILGFGHSVVSHVLRIVRPALAGLLAVWIIAYLVRHVFHMTIVRGICSIPGVDYLEPSFCVMYHEKGPAEFDELMTVQSAFEDVLSSSAGGVTLPLDMKRSESSIRDLKHVVQFSSLPSRNELVFEFGGFIETARQAASDLTHFNSRVGRSVDQVISTNRWTLQVIDGVADREASRGSVSRFFEETLFFPFSSGHVTESLLLDQYLLHTTAIEDQISKLIIEAQALLGILQNLDDRLDVIHSITTRDGMSVKGSREELFALLWTKLGGNRSSKKKHDDQLHLLQQVGSYRKTAWEHVSGTVLKLQAIAAGLEDLRERVAAPEVVGHRANVPLKLHIDNIQMAVERLESQRTDARKLESDSQRRVIDRSTQLALP